MALFIKVVNMERNIIRKTQQIIYRHNSVNLDWDTRSEINFRVLESGSCSPPCDAVRFGVQSSLALAASAASQTYG